MQLGFRFEKEDAALPVYFWQHRLYAFDAWCLKKTVENTHHMHINPLKRKLVAHVKDWPWSSFSCYSKQNHGLIRVSSVS
jgi:hypothetical protein